MNESSFFASIRKSGWVRGDDRWIGGVCSGIAEKSGWDVSLIRGILVALTLVFWIPLAFYGLAWLFLPDQRTGVILAQQVASGNVTGPALAAGAAVIIGIWTGSYSQLAWFGLIALAVGIAIAVAVTRSNSTGAKTSPQKGQTTMPTSPPPGSGPWQQGPQTPPPSSKYPQQPAPTAPPAASYASSHSGPAGPAGPGGPAGPAGGGSAGGPAGGPASSPRPPKSRYNRRAATPTAAPPSATRRAIPSALSLTVIGILLLAGAAIILLTGLSFGDSPYAWTSWLTFQRSPLAWAMWSGICLVIIGLALGIGALAGRKGGWLTGVSIAAAIIMVPSASAAGVVFPTYEWTSFPQWNQSWSSEAGEVSLNNGEGGGSSVSLIEATESFDYTVSDIDADASAISLDLTQAPDNLEEFDHEYKIDLDTSTLNLTIREDQAIKLSVDSDLSKLSAEPGGSDWVGTKIGSLAGSFQRTAVSPAWQEAGEGIEINIDMNLSAVTVVVTGAE